MSPGKISATIRDDPKVGQTAYGLFGTHQCFFTYLPIIKFEGSFILFSIRKIFKIKRINIQVFSPFTPVPPPRQIDNPHQINILQTYSILPHASPRNSRVTPIRQPRRKEDSPGLTAGFRTPLILPKRVHGKAHYPSTAGGKRLTGGLTFTRGPVARKNPQRLTPGFRTALYPSRRSSWGNALPLPPPAAGGNEAQAISCTRKHDVIFLTPSVGIVFSRRSGTLPVLKSGRAESRGKLEPIQFPDAFIPITLSPPRRPLFADDGGFSRTWNL